MKDIANKVEENIKKFIAKETIITLEGFIESYINIKKLNYCVESDILEIKDNMSENYIKINLNQIYKIENDIEKLKLYLDNDITITLEIKRQTNKSLS